MAAKFVDPGVIAASRFPSVPSLPVWHELREGTRVRLRTMMSEECEAVYELFLNAAKMGSGFSFDETFSLDQFTDWFLLDHYNVVWEAAETGEMIAFSSVGDGSCKRSRKAAICDSTIILRPAFYNRGIGGEMLDVMESLAREIGYSAMSSDTPSVNHRMCDLISKRGYCFVGFLPNCINIADRGIVDLFCSYKSLKDVKPFVPRHVTAVLSFSSKL